MDNSERLVIGGSELDRAPILKKCPCCSGIADYMKREAPTRDGKRYFVRCGKCGMQTGLYAYPVNAGEAWNGRESENARIITTQEIVEFSDAMADEQGWTACWIETIEGYIAAIMINVAVSMDGREVRELVDANANSEAFAEVKAYRDWSREEIAAEGIRWRLWDKKPTNADTKREPWGMVGFKAISDAARQEAERIRAELDRRAALELKRQQEEERKWLEQMMAANAAGET